MGIEGGGNWGEHDYDTLPARTDSERDLESGLERRVEEDSVPRDWIADIINPEKLDRYRHFPAYEDSSDEWIIMQVLLARKVEGGAELHPRVRARLGALIAAFRILSLPSLTGRERRFTTDMATTASEVFGSIQIEVTPELVEDINWVWDTFGLERPPQLQQFIEGHSLTPGRINPDL